MPPTFHIASLNRYTPKFAGVGWLTWCQQLDIQLLPKSGNPDSCPPKQAVFKCFFTKRIFPAKRSTFAYKKSHIFGKLCHSAIILPIWKPF